jgi:platelet-activating factor acetylhydrolase IB subunit beta/gamma
MRLTQAVSVGVATLGIASGALAQNLPPKCSRIDWLVTTTPAPPATWASWQIHAQEVTEAKLGADAVIIGDSLAHGWPAALLQAIFPGRHVLNLGVGGDHIQNVLWRLAVPQIAALRPKDVLILLGTNNLSAKDQPCAIIGGLTIVVDRMAQMWHPRSVILLGILPRAPNAAQFPDRDIVNAELRTLMSGRPWLNVIDASPAVEGVASNYKPDRLHLTPDGYTKLTRSVLDSLSAAGRPP